MKKAFRLTMEFEAAIHETFDDSEKDKPRRLQELLSQFIQNDKGVLDLYKIWLLGDLRVDEHHNAISRKIESRDEDDILSDILDTCSPKTKQYYMDGLRQRNERKLSELEDLFGQFGLLTLIDASFEGIAVAEENPREVV